MNETTALAPRSLTPDAWKMIETVSPVMHQCRFFGVSSPEQAAAIMLMGYGLGLSLTASFEFIHVVMGKPALTPRGALALIQHSGELESVSIEDKPGSCTVYMKRRNGFEYRLTWTMDDAKKAGVVKPDSAWMTYPANMLRWRCVGFVADVVFPDVIGGLKRADELGANITPSGDVIEGEWSVAPDPAPVAATVAPPAPAAVTLDDLLRDYTAEQIMVAGEGRIPGTDEEVAAVAARLNGTPA